MFGIAPAAVGVIGGLIGLAIVAVIVSKNAATSSVIRSAGGALSSVIGAAVSPVSGNTFGTAATGALGGFNALGNIASAASGVWV